MSLQGTTIDFKRMRAFQSGQDQHDDLMMQSNLCSFSYAPVPASQQTRCDTVPGLTIRRFRWQKRLFTLRQPVVYRVYCHKGVWAYECESLGLLSYDKSRSRARENFNEEFASLWDCIACEEDAKLAADAIELKIRLKELVTVVEDDAD